MSSINSVGASPSRVLPAAEEQTTERARAALHRASRLTNRGEAVLAAGYPDRAIHWFDKARGEIGTLSREECTRAHAEIVERLEKLLLSARGALDGTAPPVTREPGGTNEADRQPRSKLAALLAYQAESPAASFQGANQAVARLNPRGANVGFIDRTELAKRLEPVRVAIPASAKVRIVEGASPDVSAEVHVQVAVTDLSGPRLRLDIAEFMKQRFGPNHIVEHMTLEITYPDDVRSGHPVAVVLDSLEEGRTVKRLQVDVFAGDVGEGMTTLILDLESNRAAGFESIGLGGHLGNIDSGAEGATLYYRTYFA